MTGRVTCLQRNAVITRGAPGHVEIDAIREKVEAEEELAVIISHGRTGYVALYDHAAMAGVIRVAALRHQREAGCRGR